MVKKWWGLLLLRLGLIDTEMAQRYSDQRAKLLLDNYQSEVERLHAYYADREQRIVGAHRRTHMEFDKWMDRVTEQGCEMYERFEILAHEARAQGRNVYADRLMEIADGLIWALERKVGKHQEQRMPHDYGMAGLQ